MNARLFFLSIFFYFDFLSLISAQAEGQVVPAGVDDVQGNVTGYNSDTLGSTLQQQAAPADDEDKSMPKGLTADQSEIMLRKR